MDIQFIDPAEAPRPPDEVSFRGLAATPLPDGRRVHLSLEVTPFQERPSIEITVLDPEGEMVATSTVVEAVETKMTLTLHLRGTVLPGVYTAHAELLYPERDPIDHAESRFDIPPLTEDPPS